MEVATALSVNPIAAHATGEVLADLLERIGTEPTIAVVIVTPSFGGTLDDIRSTIAEILSPQLLVCAVSAGVLADGVEITGSPAIAVWAASVDASVVWTHVDSSIGSAGSFHGSPGATFVLIDPGRADPDRCLRMLDDRLPSHELVGGILSGSCGPTRLIAPDGHDAASVAIVLADAEPATVWGAAPIDEVRFAEISDGTMITHLDGTTALDLVIDCLGAIDDADRSAVARSLRFALLGPEEFGVVQVLGTDRARGAIAIAGRASDGTLVQLLRGDDAGLRDSIIRTLLPAPGTRLLATTGLEGDTGSEPTPGALVAELSGGSAIGPIVAAVVSTVRTGPTMVDAPLVVVTCDRSPD